LLPDIDSIALFVQAAEHGSLTKAAQAFNIGVAGASRRIMLLESRFKTALFYRSPRGMRLTPAGEWLLSRSRSVLDELNRIQLVMKDFAAGRQGEVRLFVNSSMMLESFPDDWADLSAAYPNLRLVVEEGWSEDIIKALLDAKVDIGVTVKGLPTNGLKTFDYKTDRLAVMVPHGHAFEQMDEVDFDHLHDRDLVTLGDGSSIMRLLAQKKFGDGRPVQPKMQVRSFDAICRVVEAGMGLGILPQEVGNLLGAGMDVSVRPLRNEWAKRRMLICVRDERTCNPLLSKLVRCLCGNAEPANARSAHRGSSELTGTAEAKAGSA
jgi:DNA-binding transcriptional LysR family regulator